MNAKIEQLTRTYLNSLNLDNNQKRRIIDINRRTNWIIFNASSLKAQETAYSPYNDLITVNEWNDEVWIGGNRSIFLPIRDYIAEIRDQIKLVGDYEIRENGGMRIVYGRVRAENGSVGSPVPLIHPGRDETHGFSREAYDLTSPTLQEILKEVVEIYGDDNLDFDDLAVNTIFFTGGGGVDIGGHNFKRAAIPTDYRSGEGNDYYWVAVNKQEIGERYDETIYTPTINRSHWKKETRYNLENLLNDPEITNSQERERERERESHEHLGQKEQGEHKLPHLRQQIINRTPHRPLPPNQFNLPLVRSNKHILG